MLKRTLIILAATAALALAAPAFAQDNAAPPMLTPTTSGYAPVNGVEAYYAIYGEGEPLVLLHGGFGAIEMFGPVLAALAEGRQVIGVDLQAHGRTAPHNRPMTFENLATDIAELIKFLGFEKADVMGYSTGGQVALRLAIDHPEVVDRLVLVSTPFARSGWQQANLDSMAMIGPASAEGMKQTPMYQMFAPLIRTRRPTGRSCTNSRVSSSTPPTTGLPIFPTSGRRPCSSPAIGTAPASPTSWSSSACSVAVSRTPAGTARG